MKVALVYDRVNKWGGAERLLLSLHELFPEAQLFTSVYNQDRAFWAKEFRVKTSFLQKLPYAAFSHEALAPLMPLAFESFTFDEYDLVISVTSEAAKGIITKPHTFHLCYSLTPTRYLWSGYEDYFNNSLFRFLSQPVISYLRNWDLIAAQRPDAYIAISKEVQKRIKTYYGRESKVVYPPVTLIDTKILRDKDIKKKKSPGILISQYLNIKGYFLIVSRLVPYKRIDLAIRACNMLELPLVIVGKGFQESYLRSISGENIKFVGNLTDTELVDYYKYCTAFIFPGYEDFGLAPIEANSFGKPVIAFGKGGATETILQEKTGIFFQEQSVNSLVDALIKFKTMKFDENVCRQQAEKFNKKRFKEEFLKQLGLILSHSGKPKAHPESDSETHSLCSVQASSG